MKKDLIKELTLDFEAASHKDDNIECWFARDVQKLLGYSDWRNFTFVIDKAKTTCANAGQDIADHFVDVNKMVVLGSESQLFQEEWRPNEQYQLVGIYSVSINRN